jgi:hypothetical protein
LRRSLAWIAPIFLTALLVQISAPVMARIVMRAASDTSSWAPICTASGTAHHVPGDGHHTSECCAFCALAHAAFVPADVRFAASTTRVPILVSLPLPSAIAPILRIACNARARAPPALS